MLDLIDGWSIVRFLHVMGAIVWVGGQVTLSAAVVPAMATHLDAATRSTLGRAVGRRYAVMAVAIGLPVQIATGIALAFDRGVTFRSFSRAGYGATLSLKIVLVVAAVASAAWHGIASAQGNERMARAMA